MKRGTVAILLVIIIFLILERHSYADMKALMEVGKNQAEIAKTLQKETKNYNKVKEAIISNKLQEGMSGDEIRKKYGNPIIEMFDKTRNAYRWLYMPATSTHFEGEKLYLFVTEEGKLVGWQILRPPAEPAEQ